MNESDLANSIDLVPTILSLMKMEVDEDLPGIDLTDSVAVSSRDTIFGEIFEHDIVDMDDAVASLRYRWIISKEWKLIEPFAKRLPNESPQLFNLADDPHENHDLAASESSRVESLSEQLDSWWNVDSN